MTSRHLAITMGDPAGIGPEIIVKACIGLQRPDRGGDLRLLIIGSGAALTGATGCARRQRCHPAGERRRRRLAQSLFSAGRRRGRADRAGRAESPMADGLPTRRSSRACGWHRPAGSAAIVTAPLNKEALNKAGYHYPGHTEMLADLTGVRGSVMLLAHGNMRVSHVSTHVALEDVPKRLTPERLASGDRPHGRGAASASASRGPRSRLPRSIRMRARAGCSAGRTSTSRRRPSPRRSPMASTSSARCRATPSSSSCAPASTTRWSRCITTRGTSR